MISTRINGFALQNRSRSLVLSGGSALGDFATFEPGLPGERGKTHGSARCGLQGHGPALRQGAWVLPHVGHADHTCPTGGRALPGFENRYAMNIPGRALSEGPPG